MKNISLFLSVAILLFSCTPSNKSTAEVKSFNGVLVFIHAEPMAEYYVLGDVKLEAVQNIVDSARTGNSFIEKAEAALSEGIQDLDFSTKLEKMVSKAKENYPDADGVIFEDRMNSCQAIKFK